MIQLETSQKKIGELTNRNFNIALHAKVVELDEKRVITDRSSGQEHTVMDIVIGDDTGIVTFSAWNEVIYRLEVGKTYFFDNSKTILYKGYIRLSLGKKGTISDSENSIETINNGNNLSEKQHYAKKETTD